MSYNPFDPSYNPYENNEQPTDQYLPATVEDVQDIGNDMMEEEKEPINTIDTSFHRNLIDDLSGDAINNIEKEIIPRIEADFEKVKNSQEKQAKQLKLLGLEPENLTEPFKGAFGGYDSTLLNSAILIYSKIVAHLFPSSGITSSEILDDAEEELEEIGEAISAYYNYTLTELDQTFIPEIKKAILWSILTGVIDTVTEVDALTGRPYTKFINPDRIALDGETCTIYAANRITVKTVLTEKEVEIRKSAGEFSDFTLMSDTEMQDDEPYQAQLEEMNNIQSSPMDEKKLYSFWQVQTDLSPIFVGDEKSSTDNEEELLPYRLAIHIESKKLVGIYRDWEKDDYPYTRIHRYSEFVYGPAIEKRGWGLLELASNNAEIATASLRQIINSNTMSTFGAGFYAKGGINNSDNNINYQPGAITPIDTNMGSMEGAIKMLTFPSPSPATMEMLNLSQSKIESTAAISSSLSAPIPPNTAVAPYLEQAEQAGVLQSYILRNIYNGLQSIFDIMHRIYSTYFPEAPQEFIWKGKTYTISREDFLRSIKVKPIADPSFSNKLQKRIVADTILKYAQQFPELHNMYEVLHHVYHTLDLTSEEINNIMPPSEELVPLDPISENANMLTGGGAKAGVWQDHQAHLVTHSILLQDPSVDPSVAQNVQAHLAEHTAMMYMVQMQQKLGFELPENPAELDEQQQNQLAVASSSATQQMLQEIQQQMAAAQPAAAENEQAMQLMKLDIESKNAQAQLKIQMEGMKLQQKAMDDQFDNTIKLIENKQQAAIDKTKEELEVYKAKLDYILKMHEIESKTGLAPLPIPQEPEIEPDNSLEEIMPDVEQEMSVPDQTPTIGPDQDMGYDQQMVEDPYIDPSIQQDPNMQQEVYDDQAGIGIMPNNGIVDEGQ